MWSLGTEHGWSDMAGSTEPSHWWFNPCFCFLSKTQVHPYSFRNSAVEMTALAALFSPRVSIWLSCPCLPGTWHNPFSVHPSVFPGCICVVPCVSTSFLFIAKQYSIVLIFCLFTHWLMDLWVGSTLRPLFVILLWTFVSEFLCRYVFSVLLGRN